MKSFYEIKKERILIEKQKLLDAEENLKQNKNRWDKSYENYNQIENSKKVLENIDEAVKMDIAANANILYQSLRDCSEYNSFYEVIKKYINDALTIFKDGNIYVFRPELPVFYDLTIIKAILYFGFTNEDLQGIIDKEIDIRFKDEFVCFINNCYGTNIPLSTEIKELSEHHVAENEIQRNQINYRWSLIRLRNGELMDGNYPLQYQDDILRVFGIEKDSCVNEKTNVVKKIR